MLLQSRKLEKMIEYFKRKIAKISQNEESRKIDFTNFPIYYSQNGVLIREEHNGDRFAVNFSAQGEEQVIRKLEDGRK